MALDSRSVLSRSARPPDLCVSYGSRPENIVDVWTPRETPRGREREGAHLLMFLHGGFWRSAYDRKHVAPAAAALADAGYLVATPEYRRTGHTGGGWPQTFDDVRAAAAALPELLAGHGPGRVVMAGHSAGAQLALWAGRLPGVAGVVVLAPVADLRAAYALDLDGGAVAELLGGGPDAVPERYAEADPMSRLPLGVPVVLVHGDRDRQVPVSFSQRYEQAARAVGDTVQLELLTGSDHFAVIDPESSVWPIVVAAVGAVVAADRPR